jgi:hypothetical protein
MSFLQHRSDRVMNVLEDACRRAARFVDEKPSSRSVMSEMHAALFAVGDCFGVRSERDKARHLREQLDSMLVDLIHRSVDARAAAGSSCIWDPVARAAGYLVVVTAEADPQRSRELVEGLATHPDPGTQRLADWALRYRFDGKRVRPLYAAIPQSNED